MNLRRIAGLIAAVGLAMPAVARPNPEYHWVAMGTDHTFFNVRYANVLPVVTYSGTISDTAVPWVGTGPAYFANWFTYTSNTSSSGTLLSADASLFTGTIDLTFANAFQGTIARGAVIPSDTPVTLNIGTLTFVTGVNAGIVGRTSEFRVSTCVTRWPDSSGTQTIDVLRLFSPNFWVAGAGELRVSGWMMDSAFSNGTVPITKSGNGTLVIDPTTEAYDDATPFATSQSAVLSQFNVYDGTLALESRATGYVFGRLASAGANASNVAVRVGGVTGLDAPPGAGRAGRPFGVPIPSYNTNAPKFPVLSLRDTNLIPPDMSVRVASNGAVQVDRSIGTVDFPIVSDTPGAGSLVCNASVYFTPASLASFGGSLTVNSGETVVYSMPPVRQFLVNSGGTLTLNNDGPPVTLTAQIAGTGTFTAGGSSIVQINQSDRLDPRLSLGASGQLQIGPGVQSVTSLKMTSGGTLSLSSSISRLVLSNADPAITCVGFLASVARITGPGYIDLPPGGRIVSGAKLDISASITNTSASFSGQFITLSGNSLITFPITTNAYLLLLKRTSTTANQLRVSVTGVGAEFNLAQVWVEAPYQLSDTAALDIGPAATVSFFVSSPPETIGGLNMTGNAVATAATYPGAPAGSIGLNGPCTVLVNPSAPTQAASITSNVDLLGGVRPFTVVSGATLNISGEWSNGTLQKFGTGALSLQGITGSVVLDCQATNISIATAELGGLKGSQPIQVSTSLTVNAPIGTNSAYSGSISGAGAFVKAGPGQLELNSNIANSFVGGTRVEGGTLFLNRAPGTTVIPGNITVASGGRLLFAGGASNQIANTADVTVDFGGTVDMAGQSDTVRSAIIQGTWNIDNPAGAQGSLAATQGISVLGGTLTGTVAGSALSLTSGATAQLRGTLVSASVNTASTLGAGGFVGADQLTINGTLTMGLSGASLAFTTGVATDAPLMRVLGGYQAPLMDATSVRVNQFVAQPWGTTLRLLDLSTTTGPVQLSQFALLAPGAGSGRGVLTLNNRVLSYVVTRNPCAADVDGSGTLEIKDIFDFLSVWFGNGLGADFNLSGQIGIDDIFAFLSDWFAGTCS